jgi:hypothetical protein
MIAIIILGLGVLTAGLNMQNNLGQVVTERTGLEAEQIKERIELRDVKINSNKFNMTLVNTGMLPVKIVRAWVTNTTAPNGWHTQYDNLNYLINPGDSYIGFGQQAPLSSLVAKTDKSYEIKVVTERGTITSFKILNGADAKLNVRLIASPPTVNDGQQVVITMLVTHNNTLADAVLNIVPGANLSPSITPSGTGSATLKSGYPTPAMDSSILRGSTRSYTYVYEVTGQNNTQITFSGGLKNSQSINSTVSVELRTLKITATDYATMAGLLTIDYDSFRWAQGTGWNAGWSLLAADKAAFQVNMTNNNVTGTLWISKYTSFVLDPIGASSQAYYITNFTRATASDPEIKYLPSTNTTTSQYTCTEGGLNDFCINVAPGQTKTLYFAAKTPQDTALQVNIGGGRYSGSFLLFGKFTTCHTCGSSTSMYGQYLPFMAIEIH